ncbi:hypothetical protein VTN31DRAFT_7373 [Thermomyces dupontii]|uniref:uncharacterized protein n=1 Tax=Talaromyces thermophilus TaxID=28565 RepID=UPI0037432F5D
MTVGKNENVGHLPTPPASPPDALMAAAMFGSVVIADQHPESAMAVWQEGGITDGMAARGGGTVRESPCVERYAHGTKDSLKRIGCPQTGDVGARYQCGESGSPKPGPAYGYQSTWKKIQGLQCQGGTLESRCEHVGCMERGLLFGYEGWGGSRLNPQRRTV